MPHLFAQTITFEKYYDTLGCYYSNNVFQNSDNGFILCGSSYHATTAQQAAIIRTDSLGNIIWVKEYGGPSTDGALSGALTEDSNFLFVGIKDQYSSTDGKIWILKLDQNGNMIWSKDLKILSGSNQPEEVTKCRDNGFIISGFCNTTLNNSAVPFALRIDSTGTVIWSKTYGYSLLAAFHSGVETEDNGFVFTGEWPSGFFADVFIVRTDSAGDTLWTKQIGDSASVDVGVSVRMLDDSSIVIAGSTYTAPSWDIYIAKMDLNGNLLWDKTLGDPYENTAECLQITQDGNLLICGTTRSASSNYQSLLMKLNSDGDSIWTATFGGAESDMGFYAIQTYDNGYAIAGKSDYFQTHSSMSLVKCDENGLLDVAEYDYSETNFVIFPNPTSNTLTINIPNKYFDKTEIKIADLSGKILRKFDLYENTQTIDVSELSQGIYIISVEHPNIFYSKLFVKVGM